VKFLPEDDPRRQVWEACESPIEQYLCCGLFAVLGCRAVQGPFDRSRLPQLGEIASGKPGSFLFSQHWIGVYRADFLLVLVDPERRTARLIVLECDGKDYHSSADQIERDAARDAEILKAGYHEVLRFTGSILHSELRNVLCTIEITMRDRGIEIAPPPDLESYVRIASAFTPSWTAQNERHVYRQRRIAAEHDAALLGMDIDDYLDGVDRRNGAAA
jgi:very-short-patch-repair endonuclease